SARFKAMREYWFPLETPRHVYLFSPDTLQASLDRAGLRTTKIWTTLFQGCVTWVDAYRREEMSGIFIPISNHRRKRQIQRALAKLTGSRIRHLFNNNNGDILHVWAMKPIN